MIGKEEWKKKIQRINGKKVKPHKYSNCAGIAPI